MKGRETAEEELGGAGMLGRISRFVGILVGAGLFYIGIGVLVGGIIYHGELQDFRERARSIAGVVKTVDQDATDQDDDEVLATVEYRPGDADHPLILILNLPSEIKVGDTIQLLYDPEYEFDAVKSDESDHSLPVLLIFFVMGLILTGVGTIMVGLFGKIYAV